MESNSIRTLLCGGREIRWVLTRKKVKNVNLRVKPDGIVYISANTRVSVKFIEDFIREKSEFIFSALNGFSGRENALVLPKASEDFSSGDTICYFGKDYTLRIEIDEGISYAAQESAAVEKDEIVVTVRYGGRVGRVLEKFYAEETRKLFETLNRRTQLMFLAKGYDVGLADLQIREMRSQWGSCHISDGKIVMNSRLALYPEICAAYVFVHEYAHFIVPNHSAAFYAVVSDIMPDYKICVEMLKR
ncbi:MAG: M48 family metallopeptidase [Oscillospiraceae bacterium]|nr:M48 family metallopeptidase [Oscillospiraceae bacterium]